MTVTPAQVASSVHSPPSRDWAATRSRRPRTLTAGTRPAPQELTLALATEPAGAGHARRAATDALRDWGVADEATDDIVLMVDELVTNAIEHGRGPVWLRLRLRRGRCVICKVGDGSHEAPRLRHSGPDAESGRGLFLVGALADAFGARITPAGKVTWFRRRLRSGRIPAPRTAGPTA